MKNLWAQVSTSIILGSSAFLLLWSGCTTPPALNFASALAYEPARSTVQINASATVESNAALTPTARGLYFQNFDAPTVANMLGGIARALRHDIVSSGLFASIVADGGGKADYRVNISWEDARVTLTVTEVSSGKRVSSNTCDAGSSPLPMIMPALKAQMIADLQGKSYHDQDRAEAELITKAPLAELLVASDRTVLMARNRNRAIVAAKVQQLPALLRDSKSSELSSLVVKIEQAMLDLDHDCEVLKDRAQQTAAMNDSQQQVDELRGLAISYRERIELLKPIASALREELANRSR